MIHKISSIVLLLSLFLLAACQFTPPTASSPLPTAQLPTLAPEIQATAGPGPTAAASQTPTPPARHLSICLGREPKSLFLYDAAGSPAQNILAAIYDGPFEVRGFTSYSIILEKIPSLSGGDARLEPVQITPGSTLVDADGSVNTLAEGVLYRPSGCSRQDCAQVYSGDQPVTVDRLVLQYRLLPDVRWSDGNPVRADDSVFSYEIARALYPSALPDLLLRTESYQAVDERTVEWKGVPGTIDADASRKFFSPLPRHAWGLLPVNDLRTQEIASGKPLGWGPYAIQDWVAGDHLTLSRNPYYFRTQQDLPHFDTLVYRFVADGQEALQALLAGECDLVDQTLRPGLSLEQLFDLQAQGRLKVILLPDSAWEMALFGIDSLDPARPQLFTSPSVRQAVGLCLDRQAVVDRIFLGKAQVAQSYLPDSHPLYNPGQSVLDYDPRRGSQMLQEAGWLDADNDPQTPRIAQAVVGVPDGTPFEFEYLVSAEGERQAVAEILRLSLAQCGVIMKVLPQEATQYLAPGPDGPVFGRLFAMAQFAWPSSQIPLCGLFLSGEIPGPYPEYPRGWGGANASGYSRAEYDQACKDALYALPEMPGTQESNWKAQEIFAEDLPAIPLYWRFAIELARPDLCGAADVTGARNSLEGVENLDYGEGCAP